MRSSEPLAPRRGRVCRVLLLIGLAAMVDAPRRQRPGRPRLDFRSRDRQLRRRPAGRRRSPLSTPRPTRRRPRTPATMGATRCSTCCPAPTASPPTLDGFRTGVNDNVQVRVGDKVQLDVTLEPGGVSKRSSSSPIARSSRSGTRDHGPGDRQQADQRDPARRRHRLRPDAPRRRRVVRALVRAAAADGQRQPARHDDQRDDQQRVHHRRLEQRRLAARASASSRRRTRSRNSRSRPPPTTRRSATPAPAP